MISRQLLATVFAFTSLVAFAGADDVDVTTLKSAKSAFEKGESVPERIPSSISDKIVAYKNALDDEKTEAEIAEAKAAVIAAFDAEIKANTPSLFAKVKTATSTGFNYLPTKIASKTWSQALFVYGSVAAATWYAFGDSIKALFADEEAETEA